MIVNNDRLVTVKKNLPSSSLNSFMDETTLNPSNLPTLIRDKKRSLMTEESELKTRLKHIIKIAKQRLDAREAALCQEITKTSLSVLQALQKLANVNQEEYGRAWRVLQYRLSLNIQQNREIEAAVDGLFTVKEFNPDDDTLGLDTTHGKPSREKYQDMIQKLQSKLEKALLEQQELAEEARLAKEKLKKVYTPNTKDDSQVGMPTLLLERYKNQHQILVEQNGKCSQQVLELLSHNATLKDKVTILQQSLSKTTTSLQKLENRFHTPQKKVFEENRQLQRALQQAQSTIEKLRNQQQALESKVSGLLDQIKMTKDELNVKITDLAQADHIIRHLEILLPEKQAIIQQQEYRLSQEDQHQRLLEANLAQETQKNIQLAEQVALNSKEIQNFRQRQTQYKEQLSKLKSKMEILQSEQQLLQKLKAGLQAKSASDQALINQLKRQKQEDDRQMLAYQFNVHDLQKQKQKAYQSELFEAQTEKLINQNRIIKEKLSVTEEQLQLSNREIQDLQKELEALQATVQTLGQKEKDAYAKKKQETLRKNQEQRKLLEAEYTDRLEQLSRALACANMQLGGLKQTWQAQRKLADLSFRHVKERAGIDIVAVLEKCRTKNTNPSQVTALADRLVNSFGNLSHKEAVITKLRQDNAELSKQIASVKSKLQKLTSVPSKKGLTSDKKPITTGTGNKQKQQQLSLQIMQFSSDLASQKLKAQKSLSEERQRISEEKILTLESIVRRYEADRVEQEKRCENLQKQLRQSSLRQRQSNQEMLQASSINYQQYIEENEAMKKDMLKLAAMVENLRREKDEVEKEVKRQKDYTLVLKKQKQQIQNSINSIKQSLETEKQEHEKAKKLLREAQRKEALYKDNKDKLQAYRTLEKQNMQLKKQLDQKTKLFKTESTRKDNLIKLLKQRESETIQQSRVDVSTVSPNQEELTTLVKTLRTELERKDDYIKTIKDKYEKCKEELDKERRDTERKTVRDKVQLDKQVKRAEQLKLTNKKLEGDSYLLKNLLRKIFGDMTLEVAASPRPKKKPASESIGAVDLSLYSEGLSILNLNADDFKQFLPGSTPEKTRRQQKSFAKQQLTRPMDQLLERNQVDGQAIYQLMARALENFKRSI